MADDLTGIGAVDDVVIPGLVISAVAHDLWASGLVKKMNNEISRIAQKTAGPQGIQYALVAKSSGYYPNVRGGTTFLNEGETWKYGETTSNFRYSKERLDSSGLQFIPQFVGSQIEIKMKEKIMIYGHFMTHGTLPPGNKIFR